ncbi:MAG: hypothetical protein COW67_01055 [Flavobacteriales bacterium CG18_big_fil_WC_8_21_14_2_50_32_9]|nr:DUF4197 domain-containing protein [Flavobacteriales bacterium]PIQ16777.1 MAG: hypothetical protein COW67_01055 [Flavobacteriales bacterium CG18_big_fil_WC_8_21_14_2_50_32_9]PJC63260.1 MAG: DUF4197 domain-containing protein [Flavobacteriales bacterium CG_4_9_14_0_2_um_filter_32_27]
MKKIIALTLVSFTAFGCAEMTSVLNEVNNSTSTPSLTNSEVISGLKEALTIGTNNSTALTSRLDGFYKNPEIFIPFPAEAIKVKEKVEAIGMKKQVDEFVLTLNRAAETASKEAAPIFVDAIKNMSIADGFAILKGNNNAATQYLREKTSASLKIKFNPIVKNAISTVEVTKYWNPIISAYNKIPFTEKQNPDLEDYVTTKAMDGLFLMIQKEEANIRLNPAARVTDILKKVFGS